MNTPTANHRERLLSGRAQLLERMAFERGGRLPRAIVAAQKDANDFDSHAQTITERDNEFAMNEHETAELIAFANALKRLDAGLYGTCLDCSAPIPADRLDAYPTALRCIGCQTMVEEING